MDIPGKMRENTLRLFGLVERKEITTKRWPRR